MVVYWKRNLQKDEGELFVFSTIYQTLERVSVRRTPSNTDTPAEKVSRFFDCKLKLSCKTVHHILERLDSF